MENSQTDRDERLDEILADYLKAAKRGEAPSRTQLLADHPDLAFELASFLDDQEQFERKTRPLRGVLKVAPPPGPGQTVGNYEILSEIAQGGMGIVYKARQKNLGRVVALKMVRSGQGATTAELQRFRSEVEAVALLDHPNIVPVYEVGEHEGQPFFSMKLVEGGNLAREGTRFKDDPRAAAALIAAVAGAVHYAHQRGILHRDLKPANILLSSSFGSLSVDTATLVRGSRPNEPVPMLTDFGLAKRVEVESNLTQSGAILGTPSYMAPEQASRSRGAVTTAADVWGLGAILYELLTGRAPFRGETLLDTLQLLLETEPLPPRSLNPRLHSDLETICLKCLDKEPQRRYASALELASDLRRFLGGEPIQARAVGSGERVWRWCRRKPVLALLTAVLFLTFAGGLPLVTWLWLQAEHHRQAAESARRDAENNLEDAREKKALADKRAEEIAAQKKLIEEHSREADERFKLAHQAVNTFYTYVAEKQLMHLPGMQLVRRELLEAALKYYQEFARRRGNDPALQEELAQVWTRVGHITRDTGSKAEALKAYQASRAIYEKLVQDRPDHLPYLAGLAGAGNDGAGIMETLGDLPGATAAQEQACAVQERVVKAEPKNLAYQMSLATMYNNLSARYQHMGRQNASLLYIQKAVELYEAVLEVDPKPAEYWRHLAHSAGNLGHEYSNRGRADDARREYQRSLDIRENLTRQNPRVPDLQYELAEGCWAMAAWHRKWGQADNVVAGLQRTIDILTPLIQANPSVTKYQETLGSVHKQMGDALLSQGKTDDALASLERSRAIREKIAARYGPGSRFHYDLAMMYYELGIRQEKSRPAEAILAYQQGAAILEKLVAARPNEGDYHHVLAVILHNTACLTDDRGRKEEAIVLIRRGLEHHNKSLTLAPKAVGYRGSANLSYSTLARWHREAKQPAQAAAVAREWRQLGARTADQLFLVAREFAKIATLVIDGKAIRTEDEEREVRKHADPALETLRQAVDAGFRDRQRLESEKSFAVLHNRDEYKQLLSRMSGK